MAEITGYNAPSERVLSEALNREKINQKTISKLECMSSQELASFYLSTQNKQAKSHVEEYVLTKEPLYQDQFETLVQNPELIMRTWAKGGGIKQTSP